MDMDLALREVGGAVSEEGENVKDERVATSAVCGVEVSLCRPLWLEVDDA